MKKALTILVALALAACWSLPALAADTAKAPEHHKGFFAKLTPEQRAELKKAKADFLDETMALRQQLAAKRVELKTLLKQPVPDAAKIKAVADEKVDLFAQIMKKHNEYLAKYPKYFAHRHMRHHGGWRHQDKEMKGKPAAGQPS